MTRTVDIERCADEPIHIPGSIQPHGALLGISEPDLRVVLASANAGQILAGNRPLPGANLAEVVDENTITRLRRALAGDPRDVNPLDMHLADGHSAHGLIHRSEGLLVLEVEPAADDPLQFTAAYRRLVRRFDRLRRARDVDTVCAIAAHEVRRLTGFDRVMVYRFDDHANGQVVAEERSQNLESYLGLSYPASDIPPQARRMYVENPVRFIIDAEYVPVPIEPDLNPLTGRPLDMTHAVLRSVSPVHCQYLQNMGVSASLSISLLSGDELWGLIACHHMQPYLVPYGTRLVAEFLAHALSARISELERVHALECKTSAYAIQSRLIDEMVSATSFQRGLSGDGATLVHLLDCDGAAIVYRGEVTLIGKTPDEEDVRDLAATLTSKSPDHVLATDCLAEVHPAAARYAATSAGLISVPISADGQDLLLWFRGEQLHSVTWAGDPNKRIGNVEGQLTPRSSFAAWKEQVRGRAVPWQSWEIEVASDFRTALAASVIHQAAELERLNARLVEADQHKDRFLATVSHELRNPLNAIKGWVHIARSGISGEELEHALEVIERNANAQADLINDLLDVSRIESGRFRMDLAPIDLAEVLKDAVAAITPAADSKSIRLAVSVEGEPLDTVGDQGRLRQVIWNLLTNAVKFSDAGAGINVTLERKDTHIVLTVDDEGDGIEPALLPHIFEPFRQGTGPASRIGMGLGLSIVKSIVELHGGSISVNSEGLGKGALFTVGLPVGALRPFAPDTPTGLSQESAQLDGLQVLVVEDQPDALRMVAALLEGHGAEVVTAANGVEALEQLQRAGELQVVVSDLDMPEMDGYELIAAMGADPQLADIPAIALTAFTRGRDRARALTRGFKHHVSKPVDPYELVAVVASVAGRLDRG